MTCLKVPDLGKKRLTGRFGLIKSRGLRLLKLVQNPLAFLNKRVLHAGDLFSVHLLTAVQLKRKLKRPIFENLPHLGHLPVTLLLFEGQGLDRGLKLDPLTLKFAGKFG